MTTAILLEIWILLPIIWQFLLKIWRLEIWLPRLCIQKLAPYTSSKLLWIVTVGPNDTTKAIVNHDQDVKCNRSSCPDVIKATTDVLCTLFYLPAAGSCQEGRPSYHYVHAYQLQMFRAECQLLHYGFITWLISFLLSRDVCYLKSNHYLSMPQWIILPLSCAWKSETDLKQGEWAIRRANTVSVRSI